MARCRRIDTLIGARRRRDTGRSASGTVTLSVGLLVVLEQRGDDARKREPGAVERVHEPRLLAGRGR